MHLLSLTYLDMNRCHSIIIGVDLSKASTGLSVFTVSEGVIKYIDSTAISLPKVTQGNYTKCYFKAKDALLREIPLWISRKVNTLNTSSLREGGGEYQVSVALESPIYGSYTSELQFYLNQEFLSYFDRVRYNVVGYSPMLLKKFAKTFTDVKYARSLSKEEMLEIYENSLKKYNPSLPQFEGEAPTSDEIDALFLGVLGSIMQSEHLSVMPREGTLLDYPNTYYSSFKERFDTLKFKGLKTYSKGYNASQFKDVAKNLTTNKHLSLECKTFYPFNDMFRINKDVSNRLKESKEDTLEYLKEKTKLSKRKLKTIYEYKENHEYNKHWEFFFNKKGEFVIQ